MDQKSLVVLSKWLLIIGGLVIAFEGFMAADIVEDIFGGLSMYVKVMAFGIPAVYLGYIMINKKGNRK